jgi:4-hydroxybenzoate polyprenyltransferase
MPEPYTFSKRIRGLISSRLSLVIKYYPIISRMEFFPGVLVGISTGVTLGLFYSGSALSRELLLYILEGIFVVFLSYSAGFMVNCLADLEVDQVHKTHLAKAVIQVGVGTVRGLVIHICRCRIRNVSSISTCIG